jgi:hypothetical protein
VKKQGESEALDVLEGNRATPNLAAGLLQELFRERGTKGGEGAWHTTEPFPGQENEKSAVKGLYAIARNPDIN